MPHWKFVAMWVRSSAVFVDEWGLISLEIGLDDYSTKQVPANNLL